MAGGVQGPLSPQNLNQLQQAPQVFGQPASFGSYQVYHVQGDVNAFLNQLLAPQPYQTRSIFSYPCQPWPATTHVYRVTYQSPPIYQRPVAPYPPQNHFYPAYPPAPARPLYSRPVQPYPMPTARMPAQQPQPPRHAAPAKPAPQAVAKPATPAQAKKPATPAPQPVINQSAPAKGANKLYPDLSALLDSNKTQQSSAAKSTTPPSTIPKPPPLPPIAASATPQNTALGTTPTASSTATTPPPPPSAASFEAFLSNRKAEHSSLKPKPALAPKTADTAPQPKPTNGLPFSANDLIAGQKLLKKVQPEQQAIKTEQQSTGAHGVSLDLLSKALNGGLRKTPARTIENTPDSAKTDLRGVSVDALKKGRVGLKTVSDAEKTKPAKDDGVWSTVHAKILERRASMDDSNDIDNDQNNNDDEW